DAACLAWYVDLEQIPLIALNVTVRKKLGLYLNPRNAVAADWMIVAEAMDFSYLEIKNYEAARATHATVGKLLSILTKVERNDIVEDLHPLIDEDVRRHCESLEKKIEVDGCFPRIPERNDVTLKIGPEGTPELFDAFICHSQSDFEFVHEAIHELEQSKLQMCVFGRDVDALNLKN
uniref:MYD88 innate immune signal transduction adaptor n=1 Tax=Seriola dumerili TaxID=41447 RepID=A0A3B4UZD9_SERDU